MPLEVKEIVASRSVRTNTGNYEGTEYFVSMKAEIDELDDPEEETRNLNRLVERSLMVTLERAYKVRGKKIDQASIGKLHGLTYAVKED